MTFLTYFYSFKNDNEIYVAQFISDSAAETFILDTYGRYVDTIWRPGKTIYEDSIPIEVPKV